MHPEDRLNVWLLLQKNNESWRRSEKALTVAGKCQEHPQKTRIRRIFRLAYRFSPRHDCPEHIPMAGDDDRVMGDP